MRLPGITIELAKGEAKPNTDERGYSGGPSWGGERTFGTETDPNVAWRPPTRWATAQKMLSDPDVSAALDAVLLPILAAGLTVVPGTDNDQGRKIAEFVQNDLENMTTALQDHRYAALHGALTDGVVPFQTIFAYDKGTQKVHLRKLALRPARTVQTWHVDDHGGPDGLTQLDLLGEEIRFDMDELLVFTHRRQHGGLVGESLLRRIYGSWLHKEGLSRIGAVAVERNAMGVPVMRPGGTTPEEASRIDSLLAGQKTNAKGFVRLGSGQTMEDFDIKGVKGAMLDPVPQMEYHRRGIYLGLLCPFLPLGSDGVGSLALSREQVSFFLMLERSVAAMEEQAYNRYLFPDWVRWNYGDVAENELPKAKVGEIDTRDVAQWFEWMIAGVQAGIVRTSDELAEQAHEMLGLPGPVKPQVDAPPSMPGDAQGEAPEDAPADVQASGAAMSDAVSDAVSDAFVTALTERVVENFAPADAAHLARRGKDPLPSVVALEALGVEVQFADIESKLDEMRERLIKRLTRLQQKQARRMAAKARRLIQDRDVDGVRDVEIESDEEAAAILEELEKMYQYGQEQYRGEIESQGGKPDKPSDEDEEWAAAYLAALSVEHADRMADRMRTSWGTETMAQMESGWDAERMEERVTGAPEKLLGDLGNQSAGQSFGLGRKAAGVAAAAIITGEIYSTMLDANVCGPCAASEGKFYLIGQGPPAPNPECEGGEFRCRCVRIPVLKGGTRESVREKSRAGRRGE